MVRYSLYFGAFLGTYFRILFETKGQRVHIKNKYGSLCRERHTKNGLTLHKIKRNILSFIKTNDKNDLKTN